MKFKTVDWTGLTTEYEDGEVARVSVGPASRVYPGMSAAGADDEPTIHHFSDSALAGYVIALRRAIEDGERLGRDTPAAKRDLRVSVALQHVRFRLRCRYGARDAYGPPGEQGTDRYDRWLRFDDAPSYALAFSIDRNRSDLGKSHVVAWQAAS